MFIFSLLAGVFTGFSSGLFGIGGGSILVTFLTLYGYDIRSAIGISIIQMLFSSLFGSYLNYKKNLIPFKVTTPLIISGLIGGYISGYITIGVPIIYLKLIFISIVSFSIFSLIFFKKRYNMNNTCEYNGNMFSYIIIGLFTGIICSSIGLGGGILIVPALILLMNFNPRNAAATGTFFVIFSSIGHLASSLVHHDKISLIGFYVGLASLIGTYIGIKLLHYLDLKILKKLSIYFYILILIIFVVKNF